MKAARARDCCGAGENQSDSGNTVKRGPTDCPAHWGAGERPRSRMPPRLLAWKDGSSTDKDVEDHKEGRWRWQSGVHIFWVSLSCLRHLGERAVCRVRATCLAFRERPSLRPGAGW